MRRNRFPETIDSRLELNGTSKTLIKTSTRRRRSVGSDWRADFLWSGCDNLFDLSWLRLIVPILKVNLYSSTKESRGEISSGFFFLPLASLDWVSVTRPVSLFSPRQDLLPRPEQPVNVNYLQIFKKKKRAASRRWLQEMDVRVKRSRSPRIARVEAGCVGWVTPGDLCGRSWAEKKSSDACVLWTFNKTFPEAFFFFGVSVSVDVAVRSARWERGNVFSITAKQKELFPRELFSNWTLEHPTSRNKNIFFFFKLVHD